MEYTATWRQKTQIRKYYYTGLCYKRSSMWTHEWKKWLQTHYSRSHKSSKRARKTKFFFQKNERTSAETIRRRIGSEIRMVESTLEDLHFSQSSSSYSSSSSSSSQVKWWQHEHEHQDSQWHGHQNTQQRDHQWRDHDLSEDSAPQLETACEGPVHRPTRLPYGKTRNGGFAYVFFKVSRTDMANFVHATGRWRLNTSSHAHFSQSGSVRRTHACAHFNHACTRGSSVHKCNRTCDVWSGLPHCASKTPLHPWCLIPIFSVFFLSRSPRFAPHHFSHLRQTRTTLLERAALTGIRIHSSASGQLADSSPLTVALPLVNLRNNPAFSYFMRQDRSNCWLWLLGLSSRNIGTQWPLTTSRLPLVRTQNILSPLGALIRTPGCSGDDWWCPWSHQHLFWWQYGTHPTPWCWSCRSGGFTHAPAFFFDNHEWEHAQDLDGQFNGISRIFSSTSGPLQTVQKTKYSVAILALQTFSGIRVGIDNLFVLRGVARLLGQVIRGSLSLVTDCDLLATIRSMLRVRVPGTVKVSQGFRSP